MEIQKINSEDLSRFGDNSFDVYFSNLCHMLAINPANTLKECLRVLKPKGKTIFSGILYFLKKISFINIIFIVWGRREESLWFSLLP
jgi:ubiquinone/menaquinone biosynthesis C-methylase UbiE